MVEQKLWEEKIEKSEFLVKGKQRLINDTLYERKEKEKGENCIRRVRISDYMFVKG